jgi:putative photosynthetic complex assembly protein
VSDFRGQEFPRGALYGAGALIATVIAVVFAVRSGVLPGRETASQIRAEQQVAVIAARDFRFADRPDGALIATDARTGEVALVLEPGSNSGFIRGVMRGMMRERTLHRQALGGPVTVTQWADGALTLKDPSTGRIIELGSFGATNRAAFAQLLAPGKHVIAAEPRSGLAAMGPAA